MAMYLFGVGERGSLVSLLSNYACGVYQRGPQKLFCRCRGLGMMAFMVTSAIISGLAAVSMLLLVRAGGDALVGLISGVMGVTLATAFVHLAIQRYRRHGSFELDGERGIVRRYRVGRMVREFAFDEVHKVSLVLDPTDGIRLSGPPSWLQIKLQSGEIFRLAKGSYKELAPVCAALVRLGLMNRAQH